MTIDEAIEKYKTMSTKGNIMFPQRPDIAEKSNLQYQQTVEWLEELKEMRNLDKTNFSDGYEKGRKDAIDEFKEKLLDLCSGGEECIDCVGGNCTKCMDNSVDYSSIVDVAEEMKDSKK